MIENVEVEARIRNIVVMLKVNVTGLEELAEAIGAIYEPEQFPGLVYRMGEPKVVMLLFTSGKLVCTGAKHEDMVREAVEKLHKILEDYDLIYYE